MFCTKCGKELYDGDRFCAFCGAEVRAHQASKNDEVVFNPLFKIEAQKKTEEILKAAEEIKQKETATAKRETVSFDWNLDGFPTEHPKKTDDAVFNWDSVLEKRTVRRNDDDESFFVERIKPTASTEVSGANDIKDDAKKEFFAADKFDENEFPAWIKPNDSERTVLPYDDGQSRETAVLNEKANEDILSTEELERELFGIFDEERDDRATQVFSGTEKKGETRDFAAAKNTSSFNDSNRDSRFYTFNQKSDEFDELLNKERERIRSMEEEYNRRIDEMDYTWVPEVFKNTTLHRNEKPLEKTQDTESEKLAEAAETPTVEIGDALSAEKAVSDGEKQNNDGEIVVEVVQPHTPNSVDLTAITTNGNDSAAKVDSLERAKELSSFEKVPQNQETQDTKEAEKVRESLSESESEKSDKEKLRYSDVFPRVELSEENVSDSQSQNIGNDSDKAGSVAGRTTGSNDMLSSVFSESDEEPIKKHTFLKVLIVILVIATLIEGAALAVRFFAPDSKAAQMIDETVFAVADLFIGGDDNQDNDSIAVDADFDADDSKTAYFAKLIADKSQNIRSIGAVKYDSELSYEKDKEYSFAEISSAVTFVDAEWADADATYGEKLLESVIKYYDGWIDTNQNEDLMGINTLEIGEIKTGENGFYVLCRVTYAAADGTELSQLQTVFVKISNGLMVINEIKEETF